MVPCELHLQSYLLRLFGMTGPENGTRAPSPTFNFNEGTKTEAFNGMNSSRAQSRDASVSISSRHDLPRTAIYMPISWGS